MPMTDYEQALVFAAKNGNEKSFEELYKIYYQKVYSLAKMTLKNNADAEDVLQLTFVSAWKNISSLEDNAAFNSWIQRITLNQCYALLRKSRPVVSIDDDEIVVVPVDDSNKVIDMLKEKGIEPTVVNVCSIKPLDVEGIKKRMNIIMFHILI